MIKKVAFAAVLAATTAMPAFAATVATMPGSAGTFAAPAGDVTIDFNSPVAAPFNLALSGNASVETGSSSGNYAQPFFSDGSAYLQVGTGGIATLLDSTSAGYQSVSFFLGSIDAYNTIELLNTVGGVIATFTGSNFIIPADGDQTDPSTNRRVTITRSGTDAAIGGLRLTSSQNALELDNVVFAVPEPATWAMMFVGFGMMGASMRYRRRGTKAVFA